VVPDRQFDQTALTEHSHGYRVHRDYAAHFFRWGFASRAIDNTMEVLDVGCGVDCPFVRVLVGAYAKGVPKRYVGVDVNRLPRAPQRPWATFIEEFDFTSRYGELGQFDRIINFEVLEHMGPSDGSKLLAGMRECLKPNGVLYLSTPVFDGVAAANHVHEYTISELAEAVGLAGLRVEQRFGTFANYREIKKVCTPEQLATLDGLNKFYSTDVSACFLAPIYPNASRNNVWVLRRRD
jgi:SAM-dependent methyltransferase